MPDSTVEGLDGFNLPQTLSEVSTDEPAHSESPHIAEKPSSAQSLRPITIEVDYDGQARRSRLQHGTHWDTLDKHNPWTSTDEEGNSLHWLDEWVWMRSESESFDQILAKERTLPALNKLVNLSRDSLPDLAADWSFPIQVPLFRDPESEDEYHVYLTQDVSLSEIECPQACNQPDVSEFADPLFLLQERAVLSFISQNLGTEQPQRRTPRHFIQLGHLYVRTARYRSLQISGEEHPVTERTDWNVILDAEDEDFPIWLVASRQQLKDHLISEGPHEPGLALPIFRGLLSDGIADYDCACILDSVRRLGPDNPKRAEFSEVLETMRKTRRIVDPAVVSLAKEQLDKLANNEPFDHGTPQSWPADPNLEVKITALLPHERAMR